MYVETVGSGTEGGIGAHVDTGTGAVDKRHQAGGNADSGLGKFPPVGTVEK